MFQRFLLISVAATAVFFSTFVSAESNRDLLLEISQQCLDTKIKNYCSSCPIPSSTAHCTSDQQCRSTLDIWAMNDDFVAFRDVKMCGCDDAFVHGIAIPKSPVTGVEDPRRPDSIWEYAWNIGSTKIPNQELALVVNPKSKRSQDQLHVHMLRFYPDKLVQMSSYSAGYVNNLSDVWKTAQAYANSAGYNDYGVLVLKNNSTVFSVFVTPFNSEHAFTKYRCN